MRARARHNATAAPLSVSRRVRIQCDHECDSEHNNALQQTNSVSPQFMLCRLAPWLRNVFVASAITHGSGVRAGSADAVIMLDLAVLHHREEVLHGARVQHHEPHRFLATPAMLALMAALLRCTPPRRQCACSLPQLTLTLCRVEHAGAPGRKQHAAPPPLTITCAVLARLRGNARRALAQQQRLYQLRGSRGASGTRMAAGTARIRASGKPPGAAERPHTFARHPALVLPK